ncbi:hypothetical protein BAUCODRAFT_125499 [Baudoinia panamericana UAMH 10762]|uniref:Uncharacterized protein n=1 Tax=Baudoinia panamericana (strain UAMH 10762) TaxID=717646 RepID=M2LHM3_BAUPA|nr:uncharacterized protein BAUCODRAFT_125499 [Baudoinia panamericana UAMH 10762]EMC93662.1 hypothetical protein BAUCODRAFT_125499 [Baudoinia panamericana UAMH 10762]
MTIYGSKGKDSPKTPSALGFERLMTFDGRLHFAQSSPGTAVAWPVAWKFRIKCRSARPGEAGRICQNPTSWICCTHYHVALLQIHAMCISTGRKRAPSAVTKIDPPSCNNGLSARKADDVVA